MIHLCFCIKAEIYAQLSTKFHSNKK